MIEIQIRPDLLLYAVPTETDGVLRAILLWDDGIASYPSLPGIYCYPVASLSKEHAYKEALLMERCLACITPPPLCRADGRRILSRWRYADAGRGPNIEAVWGGQVVRTLHQMPDGAWVVYAHRGPARVLYDADGDPVRYLHMAMSLVLQELSQHRDPDWEWPEEMLSGDIIPDPVLPAPVPTALGAAICGSQSLTLGEIPPPNHTKDPT